MQTAEPFGLVLAEAASCGTPVAALNRGAVQEIVEDGVTGGVFDSLDALIAGLPRVLSLDRQRVRPEPWSASGSTGWWTTTWPVRAVGQPRPPHTSRAGMNSPSGVLQGRALLAVFAHPDDESLACGGLLAWCAELGARVSILCATRGEMGRGSCSDLSLVRMNELEAAARALGVSDVLMLDYEDGMLAWAEPAKLEADIRDATIRIRPDVVITFGDDGLYWHPITLPFTSGRPRRSRSSGRHRSSAALRDDGALVGCARSSTRSLRGFHRTASRTQSWVCRMPMRSARRLRHPHSHSTCACAARKLAALRCHRTQLAGDALDLLSDEEAGHLLGLEYFRRANVGSREAAFIERLAPLLPALRRGLDTEAGRRAKGCLTSCGVPFAGVA